MFNIFGFYKFKKLNNLKKLKNRLENNSNSKFNPFHKLKIKIKKEVVPMGFKVRNYK